MDTQLSIDWDNLPPCTGELIISPYICMDDEWLPPESPPVNEVPIPGTLLLFAIGIAAMKAAKRR